MNEKLFLLIMFCPPGPTKAFIYLHYLLYCPQALDHQGSQRCLVGQLACDVLQM